ncbi:uncharacterized protein LOC117186575 [Drosophila miranda]|uniref:uncharacterized protein LOC117186575 n=1 Tax=Drosophila miranda TaxID=7229 RepID=UPI00143FAB70|nr:uncharacterized protein LOC117186575 [Drosophila miranda]
MTLRCTMTMTTMSRVLLCSTLFAVLLLRRLPHGVRTFELLLVLSEPLAGQNERQLQFQLQIQLLLGEGSQEAAIRENNPSLMAPSMKAAARRRRHKSFVAVAAGDSIVVHRCFSSDRHPPAVDRWFKF